jgi:hypothetical protein
MRIGAFSEKQVGGEKKSGERIYLENYLGTKKQLERMEFPLGNIAFLT